MSKLSILSQSQINDFENPPELSVKEKEVFFHLDEWTTKLLKDIRSESSAIGLVLTLGYFKCTGRFFLAESYRKDDILFAAKELDIVTSEINWEKYPKSGSQYRHRTTVLNYLGVMSFNYNGQIKKELSELVKKKLHPKTVLFELCEYLRSNKIEIPNYSMLQEYISQVIANYEKKLLKQLKRYLRSDHKKALDRLLEHEENNTVKVKRYKINSLKKPKQSIREASVKKVTRSFHFLKEIYNGIYFLLNDLSLTENVISYYGTVTLKSDVYQMTLRKDIKKYFHLICFVVHQYHRYQDTLVEMTLKSVQKAINHANHRVTNQSFEKRKEDYEKIESFIELGESSDSALEQIQKIIEQMDMSDRDKVTTIRILLSEKVDQKVKFKEKLNEMKSQAQNIKKDALFYDFLEQKSVSLQRKLTDIIKLLDFDRENSNEKILKAVDYFKVNDKSMNKNTVPLGFLEINEQELVINDDAKLRVSLYKALLFVHIAGGIKAGAVNLKHSFKYQSLEEYLISKKDWEKYKLYYLEKADLLKFLDIETLLNILDKELEKSYKRANKNIMDNKNPQLYMHKGKPVVNTPKVYKANTKAMKDLFPKFNYTSLLEIMFTVNNFTRFLDPIIHYQHKYSKKKPPQRTFHAGIMTNGCNIGYGKMAKISKNINPNELSTVINWYLTAQNMDAACNRVLSRMSEMDLLNVFKRDKDKIHSSSDGQKYVVSKESLNANQSYKYFGQKTGISIYSFTDESYRLFYSTAISSSEREAAYLIDGLMNNDVVKTDIHSSDSHGYSEIIFGMTHLMDVSFAPRIKNFKDQKIYSLKPRKHYVQKDYPILPKEKINKDFIIKHWDDILRLAATIKLKHSSASQIFKRLSSYSKQNPLYKAIKSFGRIIKSNFILNYIDNLGLRQAIEKQLNKIESLHRLAKFIFFGNNQEFDYPTKEEQEIAEGCKRLIELCIICWNYLYIGQFLAKKSNSERKKYIKIIENGSILVWHHINLFGEYDFSDDNFKDNVGFDFKKILNLKIA